MFVVVTGSRGWRDELTIRDRLRELPPGSVVMHGKAPRGADLIADRVARELGFEVKREPAKWREGGVYNVRAGFERNTRMIEAGPELVIAFWDGKSNGTRDCLDKAMKAGIATETIYARRYFPNRRQGRLL